MLIIIFSKIYRKYKKIIVINDKLYIQFFFENDKNKKK